MMQNNAIFKPEKCEISFIVEGAPVGKGRPRFNPHARAFYDQKKRKFTKKVAYNTLKTVNYERAVRSICAGEMLANRLQRLRGPVCVHITAYYPVPASWPQYKKYEALCGSLSPTVKPDIDNVIKIVLDALNGVAYDDDKQIVAQYAIKKFSETPHIKVKVFPQARHDSAVSRNSGITAGINNAC